MATPVAPLALLNETELVRRLQARDEQALACVQRAYGKQLLTVVVRLVRDEALAQDILQEGMLKIWQGIASYQPERGRFFTWMVRVCCNHAIDSLRNPRHRFNNRNRPLEASAVCQVEATATFNPEHIGLRELTLELKPRQREVIDLLYFGGCTQAEAAQQLGIPVATVKTRARAALVALTVLARSAHYRR
ncbi:RNA polymerase sigma factor [Hymenobacter armeniacus]|uniref:Sigma-70 family RNA polymerase sigma factor n=1 Tax=Hymenobacter armeniacus TaxID=2771358 RepID=A0ABR8K026_9BACT|nr:sigma-70 family RNA polymerase sigma factor [Hymenobacter armeniacus]MBD2723644.1 sigma-70 family RNA polymerase sigma factor [Hymenobacter armeniacus]